MLTTAHRLQLVLVVSMSLAVVICLLQPVEAAAEPALGITSNGAGDHYLVTFDTAGGPLTSQRRITGLTQLDFLGFTMRPATGELIIATSSNPIGAGNTNGRTYSLDFATAVATPRSTPSFSNTLADSTSPGLAVDPVTDELRVTTTSSENLRVNSTTGAFIATDTALSGGARGSAIAYDRSVVGSSATTLFGIDTNTANLIRIGGVDGVPSANGGQVLQLGSTGIGLSANVSLAISPTTGTAFMSNPATGGITNIHTVNLSTALSTLAGVVDGTLLDMVLLPPSTIQVAPGVGVNEGSGAAAVTVTRTGDTRLAASVEFTTADASALAGSDYVATAGSVVFPAGTTSRTIQVPLVTDAALEATENFSVTLSAASGGALLGTATTTVTISDTVDAIAPVVLALPLAARSSLVIGRFGVLARFSCSETCTMRARILHGTTVLGVATPTRLARAGIGSIRVKPTALGQRRLVAAVKRARTHRVKLVYVLTVRDPAGNVRIVRLPLVAVG